MTQKKLEIIGPYTPEHEGPFCSVSAYIYPVDLRMRDGRGEFPLKGYFDGCDSLSEWRADGTSPHFGPLMNAREVPVAREFWDVVGKGSGYVHCRFNNSDDAMGFWRKCADQTEIIHVREVLPGECA